MNNYEMMKRILEAGNRDSLNSLSDIVSPLTEKIPLRLPFPIFLLQLLKMPTPNRIQADQSILPNLLILQARPER